MKQYSVTGMSCAACSARVEKAVRAVPGVTECAVSLLTNSMGVDGSASEEAILAAVREAGYGASPKGEKKPSSSPDDIPDTETPALKRRLISSLAFLTVLMYISMGHTMWEWPLPAALAANPVAIGLCQLLLTAIVMIINQKFFISGFRGLLHRSPNMDTLVAMGSTAAFGYSTYALFAMSYAQMQGNAEQAMHYLHEFYFESAAMILTLITVGKMLEAHSKGKTTDALKGLMDLAPKTATLIRGGAEVNVGIAEVLRGDVFVVPLEGVIIICRNGTDLRILIDHIALNRNIGLATVAIKNHITEIRGHIDVINAIQIDFSFTQTATDQTGQNHTAGITPLTHSEDKITSGPTFHHRITQCRGLEHPPATNIICKGQHRIELRLIDLQTILVDKAVDALAHVIDIHNKEGLSLFFGNAFCTVAVQMLCRGPGTVAYGPLTIVPNGLKAEAFPLFDHLHHLRADLKFRGSFSGDRLEGHQTKHQRSNQHHSKNTILHRIFSFRKYRIKADAKEHQSYFSSIDGHIIPDSNSNFKPFSQNNYTIVTFLPCKMLPISIIYLCFSKNTPFVI